MFENYLGLTNRDAKNAHLLAKYQPDIDALCERFSEAGLLNLMTVTDQNNDRQMKPASGIAEVIASSATKSNQIHFFQDTIDLKKWCELQSKEFYQLAIEIYAQKSTHQNRIPRHVVEKLDTFIKNEFYYAEIYSNPLLMPLMEILSDMVTPATFWASEDIFHDGKKAMRTYTWAVKYYKSFITKYLTSDEWLNKFSEVANLKPEETSWLVFSHFCNKFFFDIIVKTLDKMKAELIIVNDYLHHPEMVMLITLAMLPYEVMQPVISREGYANTLTSPDEFIVKNTLPLGKANLTGYKKDTEQIFRKTYIYIALLIHPEWTPTTAELISLLEGKHETIEGALNFNSTSTDLRTKTNNISLLGSTEYVTKFLKRAKNK